MRIEFSLFDPAVTYAGRKQFDCGHALINKFVRDSLVQQVKKRLSVAYVLTDPGQQDRFVGFFTLAHHAIDASALSMLQLGSLPRQIPCARLIMLGVDQAYKNMQLGSRLMKQALVLTQTASSHMGCYGLYLDADPAAIGFYQKLGLALLEGDKTPLPSPMFIAVASIDCADKR